MKLEDYFFKFTIKSLKDQTFVLSKSIKESTCILSKERWSIEHFDELKSDLNYVRGLTGQFPIEQWNHYTELTETSSEIKRMVIRTFNVQPVLLTRAWIKFFDILNLFDLFHITSSDQTVNVLFQCEGLNL